MLGQGVSPAWRERLAVLGGVAAACVAVKAVRLLWLRAELSLGPVAVKRFAGDAAVVTGGSEGIGKATAMELARAGLRVVLVSRSAEKLGAAAADIRAAVPGAEVTTIAADLTKPGERASALKQLATIPNLTVLVANAGGGAASGAGLGLYWKMTHEDERYIYSLNGEACYSLVRALLPRLLAAQRGAVVGISSVMSSWQVYATPYGAEKAKLNAFMAGLDDELKLVGSPVTAQAMIIGPVATPATVKMRNPDLHRASRAEVAAALEAAPTSWMAPHADVVGRAIVRAIGKQGPLVTPYWGHWLSAGILLHSWWPPSLEHFAKRHLARVLFRDLLTEHMRTA